MNKKNVVSIIGILLLALPVFAIIGDSKYTSFKAYLLSEKCSSDIGYLKLCIENSKVTINSGDPVNLRLSWVNSSNVEREIRKDTSYLIVVKKDGRILVPTLMKKIDDDIMTKEDWDRWLKISRGSYKTLVVSPNQTRTVEISLTEEYDYDLTAKGSYKVSVSKIIPSLGVESPLAFVIDDIEIEVQ